jgi:hypothetical protein
VLELYHSVNSVCAQKVRMALAEKGPACKEYLMKLNGDRRHSAAACVPAGRNKSLITSSVVRTSPKLWKNDVSPAK